VHGTPRNLFRHDGKSFPEIIRITTSKRRGGWTAENCISLFKTHTNSGLLQEPADPAMSVARTAWPLDMEPEDKTRIDTWTRIFRDLVLRFYLGAIPRLATDVNPWLKEIFNKDCHSSIWDFLKIKNTIWWNTSMVSQFKFMKNHINVLSQMPWVQAREPEIRDDSDESSQEGDNEPYESSAMNLIEQGSGAEGSGI